MTALIDAAFSRVRVILAGFFALILFGFAAFSTIPREAEPDIQAPFVAVTLPLPGISPEDAERLLVKPTELELQSIEGLKQIDSLAYDGAAQIFLEFQTTVDIDQAVLDVREAVDRAQAEYPSNAEEPVVSELNLQNQFPMLTVVLHGQVPERALFQTARTLRERLETNSGVLEANLTGARDELLEVIINPETLESFNLTETEVVNAINANNQLITAGSIDLDDGQYAVKVPGLVKTAQDLASIPVRANGDNVVTIGDVARVNRTFVDPNGYGLFNGSKAIGVELTKRAGANIVETIEEARSMIEDEARFWPVSVQYTILSDRSVTVRDSLSGLTGSVVTAVLLVMIVIVAALGARSALMVGVAIPTTFLIGFFLLNMFGYTLNMMVMFGLVLAVGMLVDGAIVIVEYADRRMAEGETRRNAYKEASKRMFWPVTTSTATTLAAFVPFMFWQSTPGEFMKYLPLTLIFLLTSSLAVALIFLPVFGSVLATPKWMKQRFGMRGKTDKPAGTRIDEVDPTMLTGFTGAYTRLIQKSLNHPLLSVAGVLSLVVVSFFAFRLASPEMEFFIRSDNEDVKALVLARGNLSEEEKISLTQEVARKIENHPAIEHIYLQTGPGLARSTELPPETIGQVGIDLKPYTDREHSTIVVEELRDMVQGVPGILVEVRQREGGPPVGKDVQIEIASPNVAAMIAAAKKARAFIDNESLDVNGMTVPAFMDQEDSLPLPGIEWQIEVDRALAGLYGLSVAQAGAALQFVTDGLLVGTYRPDDAEDEIDIRVRYPEGYRDVFALDAVRVQTPRGSVPLSNIVQRTPAPQVDRITRRDGRRIIDVKANGNTQIDGHIVSQNVAIAHTREWLESGALGDDVTWVMRGADEETAAAAQFFAAAMAAAMFMIALILLLEFNNFYHAFLTLTAVVLSVFGVLLGIAISGQYVSVIMTGVGIVALAGIVVNNNIVLIDTFQHLRATGLGVHDAVIRTAAQRVRPVLLTTMTTILGLLPMVFELNLDFAAGTITRGSTSSDWWVLLSSAVIYGLAFSTILTLAFTPVMLAMPTVISRRLKALYQRLKRDNDAQVDDRTEGPSTPPNEALPVAAE
ncbi:MAG: efflux RND transporter permease subunit [Pseudomonadota bacterium]